MAALATVVDEPWKSSSTGEAARVSMKTARLAARLACSSAIEPESSMTKRMSVSTLSGWTWSEAQSWIAVAGMYGWMIWGVLPKGGPVSWEGHLSGLAAGLWLGWTHVKADRGKGLA